MVLSRNSGPPRTPFFITYLKNVPLGGYKLTDLERLLLLQYYWLKKKKLGGSELTNLRESYYYYRLKNM